MDNICESLQRVLRMHFPGVVVRAYGRQLVDPDTFDVFFVPDEGEFVHFLLHEYYLIAEVQGVPLVSFVPHTEADTLKYHPGVHREDEAIGAVVVRADSAVASVPVAAPKVPAARSASGV